MVESYLLGDDALSLDVALKARTSARTSAVRDFYDVGAPAFLGHIIVVLESLPSEGVLGVGLP